MAPVLLFNSVLSLDVELHRFSPEYVIEWKL